MTKSTKSKFTGYIKLALKLVFAVSKMSEILFEQENLPPSLKLEVKHLLNPNSLLENRIEDLKFKIKKLELRMSEAKKMSALGNKLFEQGKKLPEIVQKMEKKYPYQLNN